MLAVESVSKSRARSEKFITSSSDKTDHLDGS